MSQARALIIEDDTSLAEIFSTVTQQAQYDTEVFHNGQAALNRLREVSPDLVLLDLNLPLVSGKDILHFIRTETHLANTKVILTTANTLSAEALREDSDLVLLKPISPAQLMGMVTRLHPDPDN